MKALTIPIKNHLQFPALLAASIFIFGVFFAGMQNAGASHIPSSSDSSWIKDSVTQCPQINASWGLNCANESDYKEYACGYSSVQDKLICKTAEEAPSGKINCHTCQAVAPAGCTDPDYDCTGINWGSCGGNGQASTRTCPKKNNCTGSDSKQFSRTCCTTDTWTYSYPQCTQSGSQTQTASKTFSCTDDTVAGVTHSVNHNPSPQTRTCNQCSDSTSNYSGCSASQCVFGKVQSICTARNNDTCVPKSLPVTIIIANSCTDCLAATDAGGANKGATRGSYTSCSPAASCGNDERYDLTCTASDITCSESSHVFRPDCPTCSYNTGGACVDQKECDPTQKATNPIQKTTWRCDKASGNPAYCKGAASITEQRNCSLCTENDLYTCTTSCVEGINKTTCQWKNARPNCVLPADCNGTDGKCSNKFGLSRDGGSCGSQPGSTLPTGGDGSTMFNISGGWSGSQMIHYDYSQKRIGIGTVTPEEILEVSNASNTNATTRLRITDVNHNPEIQLQYGSGNNHWSLYVANGQGANDKSLRIWNASDLVTIDTDGKMHVVQLCFGSGSSDCKTTWVGLGGGGSVSGVGKLNGLTDTEQSFGNVDDTNVTLSIASATANSKGTHTFTLGWTGELAMGRGGTGLATAGTAGNLLRSTGNAWESWPPDYLSTPSGGTAGQYLQKTASGLAWADAGGVVPNLKPQHFNNLITNGGFESGKLEGAIGTVSKVVTEQAHSGRYGYKFSAAGAGGDRIGYLIPVKKNTRYSFSFWVKTESITGKAGAASISRCTGVEISTCLHNVGGPDDVDRNFDDTATYDWKQFVRENIDSKDNTYIRLELAAFNDSGAVFLDDISFVEGPSAVGFDEHFLGDSGNQYILGNLGIGLTAPESRLHVSGGQPWGTDLSLDATGVGNGATQGHRWMLVSTAGTATEGSGRFLIKDESAANSKVRFTIDRDGNVGIGNVTDDELEVSRFVVKDTSGKNGFHVSFQGSDTVLSTTPYPRLTAGVYLSFYSPRAPGTKGLEIVEGNKIKLTYFVMNGGTRDLTSITITDQNCGTVTSVDTNGKNTGDTNKDGKLNGLPNDSTMTPGAATMVHPEWWEFTCTTGVLTESIASSEATVKAMPDRGSEVTAKAKWKATFKTIGAPINMAPQAMGTGTLTPASATLQPAAIQQSLSTSGDTHGCTTDQKWCSYSAGSADGYCQNKNDICWSMASSSEVYCKQYYGSWCGSWCALEGSLCYHATKAECEADPKGYWFSDSWSGWCVNKENAYVTSETNCSAINRAWCSTSLNCAYPGKLCEYVSTESDCAKQTNAEWCPYYNYQGGYQISGECVQKGWCARIDQTACVTQGRTWCAYPDAGGKCAEVGRDCSGTSLTAATVAPSSTPTPSSAISPASTPSPAPAVTPTTPSGGTRGRGGSVGTGG